MTITASNLVKLLKQLPPDCDFEYIDDKNQRQIRIVSFGGPEGPVKFKRFTRTERSNILDVKIESLPTNMLRRLASAIDEGKPVHIDRVFNGSYNCRSVLESLLAHTPPFYICRPGRVEVHNTKVEVFDGHKHLLYYPTELHENGVIGTRKVEAVSSISHDLVYGDLELLPQAPDTKISIEHQRRHAQIQIALVLIGQQLGFKTWVAENDRGIQYSGKRLAEQDGVISKLSSLNILQGFPEAVQDAKLIDCIWFKNGKLMPAVMEIEHSTGITSGLARMNKFALSGPQLRDIRWTIVAPDSDRDKVMEKARQEQFRRMDVKFFPYSAVEELFSLCERRKLKGVDDTFLDCFMESVAA